MPLLLPKQRGLRRQTNFTGRPVGTWGTAVTSGGTAHVLGTNQELIATTDFDTNWVNVVFHTNQATATLSDSLVNIYIGAGGAEQVLMPNLLAGWTVSLGNNVNTYKGYGFPLHIPAGSRLSAKHQSVRISTAVTCMIELFGGDSAAWWCGTGVECVGATTGSSRGTSVTPGSTSEGTLTSIGTNTYEWGFVLPQLGGSTDVSLNAGIESCDLASGSATSNLITGLDDFIFQTSSSELSGWTMPTIGRFTLVPASTTLYLRSQFSATAEAKDYCIYGVY